MNKLKQNGPPFPSPTMIHGFGDNDYYLTYYVEDQVWEQHKYLNNANYTGSLKYMASCAISNAKIYLTGGCLISTGDPTNTCYEV